MFYDGYKCACDFQHTLAAHQIVYNRARSSVFVADIII